MLNARKKILLVFLSMLCVLKDCELVRRTHPYKTENIVIVVIDGVRYSESWGDSTHQFMPHMANDLGPYGSINTCFYNTGSTLTLPGHSALTTGVYQNISNIGNEYPKYHSLFQHFRQSRGKDSTATWIISSKSKLEALANCTEEKWENNYIPSSRCGSDGYGSADQSDSATFAKAMDILAKYHPQLILIGFKEPDIYCHLNDWKGYTKAIATSDDYIYQIWQFLNNDTIHQGRTTLFVTNDHGQHLDTVSVGFQGHGDNCEGCKHLFFIATGPDFHPSLILDTQRDLTDITATIAHLMHLEMNHIQGQVMEELFIDFNEE